MCGMNHGIVTSKGFCSISCLHTETISVASQNISIEKKKKRFILIASLIPARGQLNSDFFVKEVSF